MLSYRYVFMQSLPLYTSCLFSIFLYENIIDIKKPDGIFSPTFYKNEFSGLPLHTSIFSIKDSRYPCIINGALSDWWYWLNSNG